MVTEQQSPTEYSLLLRLIERVEQLNTKIDASHLSLIESRAEITKLREEFEVHKKEEHTHMQNIMNAFPERDFNEHHDYHEQKRQSAKSWSEIILDVKKKVLGGVVWAFLLAVGLAAWEYLKAELRK